MATATELYETLWPDYAAARKKVKARYQREKATYRQAVSLVEQGQPAWGTGDVDALQEEYDSFYAAAEEKRQLRENMPGYSTRVRGTTEDFNAWFATLSEENKELWHSSMAEETELREATSALNSFLQYADTKQPQAVVAYGNLLKEFPELLGYPAVPEVEVEEVEVAGEGDIIIEVDGKRQLAHLREDNTIWRNEELIGTLNPETGEMVPTPEVYPQKLEYYDEEGKLHTADLSEDMSLWEGDKLIGFFDKENNAVTRLFPTQFTAEIDGEAVELEIREEGEEYPVYRVDTGKRIGTYSLETGEITAELPTWAKVLNAIFEPFRRFGVAMALYGVGETRGQEGWRERAMELYQKEGKELENKPLVEQMQAQLELQKKQWAELAPGGEAREKFEKLPWYQQIAYESPLWVLTGMIPSATALRAGLVTKVGIPAATARAILLPPALAERGVGIALKYGIVWPVKQVAIKGIEPVLKKSFETALDAGLDRWLVRQGIRGNQANKVVQFFMQRNKNWLFEQGKKNLLKRKAQRMGTTDQVARAAAGDTILEAEALLLDAVKGAPKAEGVVTEVTTSQIIKLGKDKLLISEAGKRSIAFNRLAKGLTGKVKPEEMSASEAAIMVDALGRLEVKYGKPPKIPITAALIPKEFAEKIPLLREISIIEQGRPSIRAFQKIGLRKEVYEATEWADIYKNEAYEAFLKEWKPIRAFISRGGIERDTAIFRAIENPENIKFLSVEERKIAEWGKRFYDKWREELNIAVPRKDYITHTFDKTLARKLKEKYLDPDILKAIDFITPKRVFMAYLKQRTGQQLGLRESFIDSIESYEAIALKKQYYEPVIQRIRTFLPYLPKQSADYLRGYINRMTKRPGKVDQGMNQALKEVAPMLRRLPGGEKLADFFEHGNPAGAIAYQYTGLLYFTWLGFKATSAIRNLSQHILPIAEVGPENLVKGVALRFTDEGKEALKHSMVVRSRRWAYIPGMDTAFSARFLDKIRETALYLFRKADEQNVKDSFLAGYAEAKTVFPKGTDPKWLYARGDEVASFTQYIYSKMGGAAWSQNSLGRMLSPLTTWPENFIELGWKWASGRPSYVYQEFEAVTGTKVTQENWFIRRKALFIYMAILGAAFAAHNNSQVRALEYTGWTSIRYLKDIASGKIPALSLPGAVGELVFGLASGDMAQAKRGWSKLSPDKVMGIIGQLTRLASGDSDWLSLFVYLHRANKKILDLKAGWEGGWEEYNALETGVEKYDYRESNPEIDAEMFITSRVTTLQSEDARKEVLRLIEEHKLDPMQIEGYESIFGGDVKEMCDTHQSMLGVREWIVEEGKAWEEGQWDYSTTVDFASAVRDLRNTIGETRLQKEGSPLALAYLDAEKLWEDYYNQPSDSSIRYEYREAYPEVDTNLFFWGKVGTLQSEEARKLVEEMVKRYKIPSAALSKPIPTLEKQGLETKGLVALATAIQEDPTLADAIRTGNFTADQRRSLITIYTKLYREPAVGEAFEEWLTTDLKVILRQ